MVDDAVLMRIEAHFASHSPMGELMAGLFGYGTLIIIGTAVATGWRYIRTFWAQISSRMIIKQTFTDNGANAVMAYSQHYWSRSRFGPLTYQGMVAGRSGCGRVHEKIHRSYSQ